MTLRATGLMAADGSPDVATFIKQLQSLKVSFVAGAAASPTTITVTGLKATATLLCVLQLQKPQATSDDAIVADRLSETTITAANTIRLASTNTTGYQLLLVYFNHD